MTSATLVSRAHLRVSQLIGRIFSLAQRLKDDPTLQKSAISVFDQAVVSGTAFVTTILLGTGGKWELGLYYLAWSLVGFTRGIQEQIVIAPYMIYWSRQEADRLPRYAGSALFHQAIYLFLCAATLAGVVASGWLNERLASALSILVVALPLLLLRDFIRQMSFCHLQIKTALVIDMITAAVQLGLLAILAFAGMLNSEVTLAVMGLACGIAGLLWFWKKKQVFIANRQAIFEDWKNNWAFGRWALATYLLASTTPYVMPWVVALVHGESETGTFGACTSIVGFANMFMMGLCNFLGPKAASAYASGGLTELMHTLRRSLRLYLTSLGLFCVAAFFVGEWLARTCYGSEFAGTGILIGVMTLTVLMNSIAITAGNGLWAVERPDANFRADLCAMVVTMVMTIALVPMLGGLGAAIAAFVGMTADAAVRWWTLRRMMRELQAKEAVA